MKDKLETKEIEEVEMIYHTTNSKKNAVCFVVDYLTIILNSPDLLYELNNELNKEETNNK